MEELEMIVEIPKYSANKYEFNENDKKWKLDRVLHGSMFYPEEYGFIPNTIDYDGDPLDVVCLTSYPSFPGCSIPVRIIGVLKMIDQGDKDYKLITVNKVDSRLSHIENLDQLGKGKLNEISNFFLRYKELENKSVIIEGFGNKNEAFSILQECYKLIDICKKTINEEKDKEKIIDFLKKQKV